MVITIKTFAAHNNRGLRHLAIDHDRPDKNSCKFDVILVGGQAYQHHLSLVPVLYRSTGKTERPDVA